MEIGAAIISLKMGKLVRRHVWHKDMYLKYLSNMDYDILLGVSRSMIENKLSPWICMKTVDDKYVPWTASQTDLLSDDWEWVE